MSGRKWTGCSRGKGNSSCGLWGVNGDALRERNLLKASETVFLSDFFKS